jgi:hypothetical protein
MNFIQYTLCTYYTASYRGLEDDFKTASKLAIALTKIAADKIISEGL